MPGLCDALKRIVTSQQIFITKQNRTNS